MDTLEELKRALQVLAEERDWTQFHTPKNLAMALAGEVGELLAELQWLDGAESRRVMDEPERAAAVRHEVADVLIYLVRLADVLDIDLLDAAAEKLVEVRTRYPAGEVRGRSEKRELTEKG